MENTCSQEFLGAYAAGTQKLGPQITADSGLGQPEQDHQTFGVSDTGRITVVMGQCSKAANLKCRFLLLLRTGLSQEMAKHLL